MKRIKKAVRLFEDKFDRKAAWLAYHHPYLAFAGAFIGMPVFVLTAVFAGTMAVMLPLSLLFGWM